MCYTDELNKRGPLLPPAPKNNPDEERWGVRLGYVQAMVCHYGRRPMHTHAVGVLSGRLFCPVAAMRTQCH
jgi:hypothetical protein